MTTPDPNRQRAARALIDEIFQDAANTWVIHYSCESFYERPEGRSPRITSLAVRNLNDAQTTSFSIHKVAERRQVPTAEITDHYDGLERQMIAEFYDHIRAYRNRRFLHWNMRDANYGFAAIEHRFGVLGGDPYIVEDNRKHDLSRIIIDIYGKGYIGHPRIEKLLEKNSIAPRDFMNGEQEAAAFDQRNFVGLHQSTLRKVDVFANFAGLVKDRQLKTNTRWWEMHGGRYHALYKVVVENKTIAFVASLLGIGVPLLGLYWWLAS